jgi:hypothetical protein
MPKFVIITDESQIPAKLTAHELVIRSPDFMDEIKQSSSKALASRGRHLVSVFHLKDIVGKIGFAYAGQDFDPYKVCPYSIYDGVEYQDDKDLSDKIVKPLFRRFYPSIFYKFVDYHVKKFYKFAKVYYYVGSSDDEIQAFIDNGVICEESVEAARKPQKPKKKEELDQTNEPEGI